MNKYISVRRSSGFANLVQMSAKPSLLELCRMQPRFASAIRWQGASKLLGLFLLLAFTSCTDMHDPLLHTAGRVEVKPEVEQSVNIETMWQADWQEKWQVDWEDETHEEIGYTQPESYHMDYFLAGGDWIGQRDMESNSIRIDLGHGTYDLLTYNNDTQNIRFKQADDWSSLIASTDAETNVVLPDTLKRKLDIRQMPDQLFSMHATDVVVSDRLEDYEFIPEENIYLLRLNAELTPRTFIYLVQVELRNNDGTVKSSGNMTVTGLASSVDLISRKNSDEAIAHHFGTVYQSKGTTRKSTSRTEDVPPGENQASDYIGGRLVTFGLPDCIPGETLPDEAAQERNLCYVVLKFSNGYRGCIPVDITDQMRALPQGGVINIVMDVEKLPKPSGSNSGWGIGVNDWNQEDHQQEI